MMEIIEVKGIGTKEIENTMTIELDGERYDEAAIATDGTLVAYIDGIGEWVQLWRDADEADYEIVND